MLELIEGAAILAAGLGVGSFTGRRRRPKPPKAVKPICGCEHHLSLHDPKSNRCFGYDKRPSSYRDGMTVAWRFDPCTCRQYVGPKPAESFFVDQIDFNSAVRILPNREKTT